MGRVIRREIVAYRCELRSCDSYAHVYPTPIDQSGELEEAQLGQLVSQGWVFVLTAQLRSYCPEHSNRAWACSCRTNPDRRHLCTVHSEAVAQLIWHSGDNPEARLAA